MKGRFRILKTGIRLHGQRPADKIFRTCCALHNWLLNVDGLDKQWENGARSVWEGELGHHDFSDANRHIPHPLRRILSRSELVR